MATTFTFQVPALSEAPSEELVDKLHDGDFGGWEGDDSGMVFHNDHVRGNQKVVSAYPGQWVKITQSGAEVYDVNPDKE